MEPRNDLGPHCGMCVAPEEDREMLQAHSDLAGIFDEAGIPFRHRVDKGDDRLGRRDCVCLIDHRQRPMGTGLHPRPDQTFRS
jgi:hypothetical protein